MTVGAVSQYLIWLIAKQVESEGLGSGMILAIREESALLVYGERKRGRESF